MKIKKFKKISMIVLFVLITFGCAAGPRIVKDPTGREVPLPECKSYIGKFSKIGLNFNILDKYKGTFELSSEYKTDLENLYQLYKLQAEYLCSKAGTYIASGKSDEWFCRDERLSNSTMQVEYINKILEGTKNIEDAQNKSAIVKNLINDFINRFYKQFDMPCSSAPKPITEGVLLPGNEPTPPNPCQKRGEIPSDAVILLMGNQAIYNSTFPHTVLEMSGRNMLSIDKIGMGMTITADVFSADGRIIAELVNNDFYVNPNNYFKVKHDANSLIVHDQEKNEVLNVRYLNPSTIKIKGIFRYPNHWPFIIGEDKIILGNHNTLESSCFGNNKIDFKID